MKRVITKASRLLRKELFYRIASVARNEAWTTSTQGAEPGQRTQSADKEEAGGHPAADEHGRALMTSYSRIPRFFVECRGRRLPSFKWQARRVCRARQQIDKIAVQIVNSAFTSAFL
jgi:hypothetical protein